MIHVNIKSTMDDITFDDQSKTFLAGLKSILPDSYFTNMIYVVNLHPNQQKELEHAMMMIKNLLALPSNPQVTPMSWNFTAMRDILHSKTINMIKYLSDIIYYNGPDISERKNFIQLDDLKRILCVPKKSNIVTCDLRDMFSSLRHKGYAGHIYIDARLTIYIKTETENDTVKKLKEAAEKLFDAVDVCVINEREGIRIQLCTSIAPDERAENHLSVRGTLGALAKMNPTNKTVAVSAGHFSSDGKKIRIKGRDIGKCIWPLREDNSCNLDDVSIVEISESFLKNSFFLHQNMQLQYRKLSVSREPPSLYLEVFKGRDDVGITTGTVTSVEACLPYRDGVVTAYVVEGELDTDFAMCGDSGSVVKQVYEENGKLVGLAIVFGLAFDLPNIRENTCIAIPLWTALDKFESHQKCSLSFDV